MKKKQTWGHWGDSPNSKYPASFIFRCCFKPCVLFRICSWPCVLFVISLWTVDFSIILSAHEIHSLWCFFAIQEPCFSIHPHVPISSPVLSTLKGSLSRPGIFHLTWPMDPGDDGGVRSARAGVWQDRALRSSRTSAWLHAPPTPAMSGNWVNGVDGRG